MTKFAWNPAWFHQEESCWSLANKLAFACDCSVDEVLEYLAGAIPRQREAFLFPDVVTAIEICSSLDLDLALASRTLFAAVGGRPSFEEREPWQIGIRFCPDCLVGMVHRKYFQDVRHSHCLTHGTVLQEYCPSCDRHVDPLCRAPWTCNFCHCNLVHPGRNWLDAFRRGATKSRAVGVATSVPTRRSKFLSKAHSCWGTPVDRFWVGEVAFEEHAALTHVFLGKHRSCMANESEVAMAAAVRPVAFLCPLAAAALCLGKRLGIEVQGSKGAWPNFKPFASGADALYHLEHLLALAPAQQHEQTIRACVLSWFQESLEVFMEAAAEGDEFGHWIPSPDPRLAPAPRASKVEDLVSKAEGLCRQSSPYS